MTTIISRNNEQQQQPVGGGIIKTTARFQEAQEPLRQKPIIQIDPAAPVQQYENLARSSIDSGRDNPFRPDGKIYKSADPIVDYYKYGPHQSRTQSPTDSKLLMGGSLTDSQEADSLDDSHESDRAKKTDKKNKNKKKKKRKRRKVEQEESQKRRKPCWRRWFCCCCCCLETEDGRCRCCCGKNDEKSEEKFDTSQYDSPPSVDAKTKDFKQSKIVILHNGGDSASNDGSILRDGQNGTASIAAAAAAAGNTTTDDIKTTKPETIPILATDQKLAAKQNKNKNKNSKQSERNEGTEQTEPKKAARCVIS